MSKKKIRVAMFILLSSTVVTSGRWIEALTEDNGASRYRNFIPDFQDEKVKDEW